MSKKQVTQKNKIPMKVKLGWSSSAFSLAVSFAIVAYISFYATDVMGLNIGVIGVLLLLSKVFDGFTDVIMGAVIDKTKTRWGKARPWALAVIPYWVVIALQFSAPRFGSGSAAGYVYFFALYVLTNSVFATMYYCSEAPYMANALEDGSGSITLLSFSSVISTLGGLVGGIMLPQLASSAGSDPSAWAKMSWTVAIPMMIIGSLRFFLVKEIRDTSVEQEKTASMKELLMAIRQNKYIFIVAVLVFISYLATGLSGQVATYYNQYILGDLGMGSVLSLALFPVVIVMILMPMLSRKVTMKKTVNALMIIGIVGALLRFLSPSSLLVCFISTCMTSISFQVYYGIATTHIIECMDYGEWKSGIRVEGLMGSVSSVMNKVGSGVGVAVASGLMAAAGYSGTAETISSTALGMIIALTTVVPAILGIIFLVIFHKYDLESQIGKIRDELAEKRADTITK